MYKIKLYNNIAQKGLDRFTEEFEVSDALDQEDAIVVRSANLHDLAYGDSLKAIARAGAGVNNIDLDECTRRGIVVFNTPGANSNAVKELVFAGLLLASRDVYHGIEWCKSQTDNENLAKDVEKQKKNTRETKLPERRLVSSVWALSASRLPIWLFASACRSKDTIRIFLLIMHGACRAGSIT